MYSFAFSFVPTTYFFSFLLRSSVFLENLWIYPPLPFPSLPFTPPLFPLVPPRVFYIYLFVFFVSLYCSQFKIFFWFWLLAWFGLVIGLVWGCICGWAWFGCICASWDRMGLGINVGRSRGRHVCMCMEFIG